MTDTAKSAREIIAESLAAWLEGDKWLADFAPDLETALNAAGLHIVATPAVGEVSEELRQILNQYFPNKTWEVNDCAKAINDNIAPRLKAEGLREGAAIVRPLKLGQFIKHPVGAMAGAADLIEARADAMEKGEA